MPLSEYVYCVAITFKMAEQAEQQICVRFCVGLEHSSMEIIWMIQKATAMGNWWLAASSWQRGRSHITSCAEVFGETSNHSGDSVSLQPWFGSLRLLSFPKTKITFEREEISDHRWDSGNYDRAADGDWENCVRSKVPTLKGAKTSLSYVQCFFYLVSSSINASIFHNTWLDTFWTDLVFSCICWRRWPRLKPSPTRVWAQDLAEQGRRIRL